MLIAGIDEAGRGPVIGPMVMSICVIDSNDNAMLKKLGVKDSKQVPKDEREKLFKEIKHIAKEYHTLHISANEIDKQREKDSLNYIETKMAAKLINKLKCRPEYIYVDCPQTSTNKYKDNLYALIDLDTKLVVENKADINYVCVSAASILAKVERDSELEKTEKELGFALGCGYPHDEITLKALNKLEKFKPDFIRKSWQTYIDLQNKNKQKKLF
jgi:ribonuclease HII